jgi:hypothetical protein
MVNFNVSGLVRALEVCSGSLVMDCATRRSVIHLFIAKCLLDSPVVVVLGSMVDCSRMYIASYL